MNKILTLLILVFTTQLFAQNSNRKLNRFVKEKNIKRIIKTLSADDMLGRDSRKPDEIAKASAFIETEFEKIGLQKLEGQLNFRQEFQKKMRNGQEIKMNNVVGKLEGKSRKNEYVIFSAHYDHIGKLVVTNTDSLGNKTVLPDSIANGADDDASGTTAVIALAKYFKKMNNNERTLVFVAFTAEEIGGFGSKYFSEQMNPDQVMAMINIEMIGKPSKWGKNSAFMTGIEKSSLGEIMQKNLIGTPFAINKDPYPEQDLFYRSDNATLARQGVPAHSFSTDQIDSDLLYHSVDDEFESLDMSNITTTIKALAIATKSIISGIDTPTRVDKASVRK